MGIETYAVNWPIGSGKEFQGVYDREKQRILFFQAEERGKKVGSAEVALDDPALEDMIGGKKAAALREAHPELSLAQLAALCDPPVTKSSLSHRLRKLIQLSQAGAGEGGF